MARDHTLGIVWNGKALTLDVARRFRSRFLGLMGRRLLAQDRALLLPQCAGVHTCFMRFALDLVYLNRDGKVQKIVPGLQPWRISFGGRLAVHALELAEGGIARLGLQCGQRMPEWESVAAAGAPQQARHAKPLIAHTRSRQDGASMLEFALIGPLIGLIGLGILQYGMLFFARGQINHAAFMAARAGTTDHARLDAVQQAYLQALVPLYGGGRNAQELAAARARAEADLQPGDGAPANFRIDLLNPTRQSFDDWNDPALQALYGARAISNSGLSMRDRTQIGASSGQNIQDANLIKLRITHGYEPKVPLVRQLYSSFLQATDSKTDAFYSRLVNAGRIPVQTEVVLHMQSDAIEQASLSVPDPDRAPGSPSDPPGASDDPAACNSAGCPGSDGGSSSGGLNPGSAPCPDLVSTQVMSADLLFEFGRSELSASGKRMLDQWIAANKDGDYESITLTGHTDPLATPGFDNQQLSLDRAESVRAYMQSHGLADKTIYTQGMGAQQPLVELNTCPNSGQARIDCLAPNRRVEISVVRAT